MNPRLVIILSVLACFPVAAEPVNVRFLAWDETIALRQLSSAGSPGGIEGLHPLQRTRDYKVEVEEGTFMLFAEDKAGAEGGPPSLAVKIKEGMRHPLVLLLPKPGSPTGLATMVIEDDESSFKWGSVRAFNATPRDLAVSVGAEGKLLPAGWKAVDYQPEADRTVPVMIVLPEELKKAAPERRPLFSTVWTGEAEVRSLAIIVPGTDPRLGPVAVKVISEDRRVLAAERAAVSNR